jgi:ribosome-associated protein
VNHAAGYNEDDDADLVGLGTIVLAPGVSVSSSCVRWAFSRSGGPGGQNVNKVSTRAELRVALADLGQGGLRPRALARLSEQAGSRLAGAGDVPGQVLGEIVIVCQSERSQSGNKRECLQRLREMLVRAQVEPKVRRATRPTRGSKERRLTAKRVRGQIKRGRGDGGGGGGGDD